MGNVTSRLCVNNERVAVKLLLLLILLLMTNQQGSSQSGEDFKLKGNNEAFCSRLNSVFDGLNPLERQHREWETMQSSKRTNWLKPDPESLEDVEFSHNDKFVRPRGFAPKKRKVDNKTMPGFKRHPEKWTKYSLTDVSSYEMSDESNSQVALSFLKQLKKEKSKGENEKLPVADVNTKIIFQKPGNRPPKSLKKKDTEVNETTCYVISNTTSDTSITVSDTLETCTNSSVSGKLLMPECVVGLPTSTKYKKKLKDVYIQNKDGSCSHHSGHLVSLDHLNDYEEEAEEEELNKESVCVDNTSRSVGKRNYRYGCDGGSKYDKLNLLKMETENE
ncbi:uncharacterized protein LOC106473305 [Limulus polyphemus]|uniref:U5 small nuclear ribonucleoprotein TSSC4 n=1 Tax=Limulus polyphemus TaxID=6850 RepID=A0ABM1BVF7_LIMPO|nr:uncharacterized protein LOC106473305 [Limulus polyphemus]